MTTLTLADIKPYLRMDGSTNDTDLPGFIAAAEQHTVNLVGPLVHASQTKRVRGSGSCDLVVPVVPVYAVASVTGKSGSVVAVDWFSSDAGVLHFETYLTEAYYDVVYTAGHAASAAAVPADLLKAVAEYTRYLWLTQRGTGGRGGAGNEESAAAAMRRFESLISDYRAPGFA